MKATITDYRLSLNETSISKIDLENEEVMVFEEKIKSLFSFLGDGISDFQFYSKYKVYWQGAKRSTAWQNEITLIFVDNAWGGISIEEWNKAEKLINNQISLNSGLEDYVINPSKQKLELKFEDKFQMGWY